MIESVLANLVAELVSQRPKTVIAICGAADLGKSHLARNLMTCLNDMSLTCGYLALDSFLMNRDCRIKNKISGYDITAYNTEKAHNALTNFSNSEEITYYDYDHKMGRVSSKPQKIAICDALLLDGVQSMHQTFARHIDLSIFIYTDDEQLKAIRAEANMTKRGQSSELSKLLAESEFQAYKTHVEPFKINASYKLYLTNKWHYELIQ